MVDVADIDVPVVLTYYELRLLRAAGVRAAKRALIEDERKPFFPEPGKINKNQKKAEQLFAACDKLDAALTQAIAKAKGNE